MKDINVRLFPVAFKLKYWQLNSHWGNFSCGNIYTILAHKIQNNLEKILLQSKHYKDIALNI